MRTDAEIVGSLQLLKGHWCGGWSRAAAGGGGGLWQSHNKSLDADICNVGDVLFFYFTLLIPRQSWMIHNVGWID